MVTKVLRGIDVAKYFISLDTDHELFNKTLRTQNGRTFYEGNARLNKYMHLAQNIYIAKYGRKLMDSTFYAYDNGAVDPMIQENYGAILRLENKEVEMSEEDRKFLNSIYKAFQNASLDELIELSHEDSEWEKKHSFYKKEDQKMDSLLHQKEYAEQYADIIKVLERMSE